ncbi:MAG TPA: hypothetical protein VGQ57_18560 [Polyangiaceae bacterium]|jgi:hypothetical protein|nr:hypothetical protein [Polyangiaceae bacterium]
MNTHLYDVRERGLAHRLEAGTQLAVYAKGTVGAGFRELIATRLGASLRGVESRVERVVVRFEDLNGPKGGADTACRIHLTLSGQPVLVVEARGEGEAHAFRLAVPRLAAALVRRRGRDRARSRSTLRVGVEA